MPWVGGTYSTSYDEIMSHLFDHCMFMGDKPDPECVRRTQEHIEREEQRRIQQERSLGTFGRMLKTMSEGKGQISPFTGQYAPRNEAERIALNNWMWLKEQRPTQTKVLLGGFETQPDLYAMQTKGRVNVNYGSGMSTSYGVKVEGPHAFPANFTRMTPARQGLFVGRHRSYSLAMKTWTRHGSLWSI